MTIASVGVQASGRPETGKAIANPAPQAGKPAGSIAANPAAAAGAETATSGQGWLGSPSDILALFGNSDSATTTTVTSVSVSVEITATVSLLAAAPKNAASPAIAAAKQGFFAALQKQQDDGDKLVGTLQGLLDNFRKFNQQSFASASRPQRQTAAPKTMTDLLAGLTGQA